MSSLDGSEEKGFGVCMGLVPWSGYKPARSIQKRGEKHNMPMLPLIVLASSWLILLLLSTFKSPSHCFQALSLRMHWTRHPAPPCSVQWDGFVRMHAPSLSWIPSFLLLYLSSLEWPWLAVMYKLLGLFGLHHHIPWIPLWGNKHNWVEA